MELMWCEYEMVKNIEFEIDAKGPPKIVNEKNWN